MHIDDHGTRKNTLRSKLFYAANWLTYKAYDIATGVSSQTGTNAALQQINRPVLLIATGRRNEQRFARHFKQNTGDHVTLWELPQAHHAGAYFYNTQEYQKRVAAFFDQALGIKRPGEGDISDQNSSGLGHACDTGIP